MTVQSPTTTATALYEVAARIRDLREISGYTQEQMAGFTGVSADEYKRYEAGSADLPFSFIHKCALSLGVEITDIMEGSSARLTSYNLTRRGDGQVTAREEGIEIVSLAPMFRKKIAEPFYVTYAYSQEQQNKPIGTATHSGQEYDYVISGQLKVQIGDNTEILSEGDCIYYDSSTPHGMIAVGGSDCVFLAVVLPGEEVSEKEVGETITAAKQSEPLIYENFILPLENENGELQELGFKNEDKFNFAFDIIDAIAEKKPDKLAMLHLDREKQERRFTFRQISRDSGRAANYFKSLGIKKGDRVLLCLKRNWEFWPVIIALHKLGAIAVLAPDQLLAYDFAYRFDTAGVTAVVCTSYGDVAHQVELAADHCKQSILKITTDTPRAGWHLFDEEFRMFSSGFKRTEDTPCGDDTMVMFFTSGTTGYPRVVVHSYKYPLAHFVTAKYWHCVDPNGLHLTISDTGWAKSVWGKLYGQWLCEAAIFVYDFDRFNADDILPLFKKYGITTFCAPPTMYRMMIKMDLSKYDLSSIKHATTAGEALNPEVFHQFRKATGLSVMEGFGQTESSMMIGNLVGMTPKIGSMGKPSPLFDVDIVDTDDKPVEDGETGEIVVHLRDGKMPIGLLREYYNDRENTDKVIRGGLYHTGDTAWRDEDGYFWYVGRVDDVIKSSGYRIGPFEIESVIMELPYILECGVSAEPDDVRGQVVKASIVLVPGTTGTPELKKEIQEYVKKHTAPYKYPRIVVFRDELPKTISGKIQRNKL